MDSVKKNKVFITEKYNITEFESIFRKYYRPLFFYAYGFVMDEMEAEDIVQEAFSIIWEKRTTLPEQLDIQAYLYATAKHACLKYFRRLKLTDQYRRRHIEALLLSFEEDTSEDEEIVQTVKKAMSTLTEQQTLIVRMHINEGLTYHEIALQLKLTDNTVKTHLKRAYHILRKYLACFFPSIPIFFIDYYKNL